jgi:zinc/manganese transport system substrate-binding protein
MFVSRKGVVLLPLICLCFVMSLFLGGCGSAGTTGSSGVINVVAAENFYGDVVKQLGGSHVSVTSILSDPNTDPHLYESNNATAQAVSKAQLVIENGVEYDSWMEKLLSASPNPSRVVLTAGNIADHKLPDNPHIWYGINNMPTIATAITNELKKLDSADASTFDQNLTTFTASLQPILQKITDLKAKYAGMPVGLTETIYLYQTTPIGLNVLTPYAFQKANAEGNDPPADSALTADDQITKKEVKILIYNQQTITTITTKMQSDAKSLNIPIVSVWETMPPGKTYQSWMQGQLDDLGQALATATGK